MTNMNVFGTPVKNTNELVTIVTNTNVSFIPVIIIFVKKIIPIRIRHSRTNVNYSCKFFRHV